MADASSPSDPSGFRRERRLGDEVWEAVQTDLGRRVALRRLPPGTPFDVTRWPQGSGAVPLYAVVETPDGTYVATRWIPGARTLAQSRGARPARRRRWLDEVEATLAGAPHGDLTAHDVLVDGDGHALVTGFGRPPVADDGERIAALREVPARRSPRLPAAVAALLVVVAVVTLAFRGDDAPAPAPPVTAGAIAFGSDLAPGAARTVDCDGDAPSGSSPACTIVQTDLRGRPLVVGFRGLVRAWAVRGARGELKLQILAPTPKGYVLFNTTRTVTATAAVRGIPADRSVPKGARFALEVAPGSGVGVRNTAGASTGRFFGPARVQPRFPRARRAGQELLLRVDVVRAPVRR